MLTSSSIGATAEPDWEHWFIGFDRHSARDMPVIQRDRWPEQLKLHCGTDIDPIFARAVADASSHQEVSSDSQYGLARDLMLHERREKHRVLCISTG